MCDVLAFFTFSTNLPCTNKCNRYTCNKPSLLEDTWWTWRHFVTKFTWKCKLINCFYISLRVIFGYLKNSAVWTTVHMDITGLILWLLSTPICVRSSGCILISPGTFSICSAMCSLWRTRFYLQNNLHFKLNIASQYFFHNLQT